MVDLAWTDNSASENTFEIQRSANGCAGGGWTTIGSVLFNITTFQDIGATPAIANGYQVRATNTFGSSAWSNCVTATTPAIGAPSSLTATAVLPSQINLAWTDNSIYESGFAVQRKSGNVCDNTGWSTIATPATPAANATTYSNTSLIPDRYTYRVGATLGGFVSTWSNCATATIPIATAPTLIAPSGTISTNTQSYRWTPVPGATSYRLHVYDTVAASNRIYVVYTVGTGAGQVDCTTVPGEYSITPAVTLNNASHWWRVQARGPHRNFLPWLSVYPAHQPVLRQPIPVR